MRKTIKLGILTTALVTSLSTITPVLNVDASSIKESSTKESFIKESLIKSKDSKLKLELTSDDINRFNDYVILNSDNIYSINQNGINNLSKVEYEKLNSTLALANEKIKKLHEDVEIQQNFEIEIVDPQVVNKTEENLNLLSAKSVTYKEGVSKVTTHWWGLHIKISKTHANKALAGGMMLGGIWMPSKVLSSIGAVLGLTSKGLFKGGIWLDQYWVAGVGPLKTLFGFNSAGYQ